MNNRLTKLCVGVLLVLALTMVLKLVFGESESEICDPVTVGEKEYTLNVHTTLFGYYTGDVTVKDLDIGTVETYKNASFDPETGACTDAIYDIWPKDNPFLYLYFFSYESIYEYRTEGIGG